MAHQNLAIQAKGEVGIGMLSSVLKSERAVQVNIAIIRSFIELRKGGDTNRREVSKIESFDDRFGRLENKLSQVLDQIKTLTKIDLQSSEHLTQAELINCRSVGPIEKIQTAVAKYFEIKAQALALAEREKSIVLPRQITMYLVRKYLGLSFKDIGRQFGRRDHTTVMHACKKIGFGLEQGAPFKDDVRSIERTLYLDAP